MAAERQIFGDIELDPVVHVLRSDREKSVLNPQELPAVAPLRALIGVLEDEQNALETEIKNLQEKVNSCCFFYATSAIESRKKQLNIKADKKQALITLRFANSRDELYELTKHILTVDPADTSDEAVRCRIALSGWRSRTRALITQIFHDIEKEKTAESVRASGKLVDECEVIDISLEDSAHTPPRLRGK